MPKSRVPADLYFFLDEIVPKMIAVYVASYLATGNNLKESLSPEDASHFVERISAFSKIKDFIDSFVIKLERVRSNTDGPVTLYSSDHEINVETIECFIEHCWEYKDAYERKSIPFEEETQRATLYIDDLPKKKKPTDRIH